MQKSLQLCSVPLHQWRLPQFALKHPCDLRPPSPPGDRHLATVSPPHPLETVTRATGGDFKRGSGYAFLQGTIDVGAVLM